MKKVRSAAQVERQRKDYRANGRYAKVNPCEVCHKSAGVDYYSDERVDGAFHGYGLVLCGECATRLSALSDAEALALLEEASS